MSTSLPNLLSYNCQACKIAVSICIGIKYDQNQMMVKLWTKGTIFQRKLSLKPTFKAYDYNIIRAPRWTAPHSPLGCWWRDCCGCAPTKSPWTHSEPGDSFITEPCLHHVCRLRICKKHNCQERIPSKPFVSTWYEYPRKGMSGMSIHRILTNIYLNHELSKLEPVFDKNSLPLDSSSWSLVVHLSDSPSRSVANFAVRSGDWQDPPGRIWGFTGSQIGNNNTCWDTKLGYVWGVPTLGNTNNTQQLVIPTYGSYGYYVKIEIPVPNRRIFGHI